MRGLREFVIMRQGDPKN